VLVAQGREGDGAEFPRLEPVDLRVTDRVDATRGHLLMNLVLQRTASDRVATRLLSSSEDGHESRTLRQHGSRVDGHGLLGAHVGPIFKIVVLALLLGLRASELV
jgi:hypothetical protein